MTGMKNNPCQRCGNRDDEATPFNVMVDGEFQVLDLGCVATLRMQGHTVETNHRLVQRPAA